MVYTIDNDPAGDDYVLVAGVARTQGTHYFDQQIFAKMGR